MRRRGSCARKWPGRGCGAGHRAPRAAGQGWAEEDLGPREAVRSVKRTRLVPVVTAPIHAGEHFPSAAPIPRPGILHTLTSGGRARRRLSQWFRSRSRSRGCTLPQNARWLEFPDHPCYQITGQATRLVGSLEMCIERLTHQMLYSAKAPTRFGSTMTTSAMGAALAAGPRSSEAEGFHGASDGAPARQPQGELPPNPPASGFDRLEPRRLTRHKPHRQDRCRTAQAAVPPVTGVSGVETSTNLWRPRWPRRYVRSPLSQPQRQPS